ncbi:hypothetical protein G7092_27835 [Mucilaginibacter sp. HC2]|uniref:hypothetical protein n=1 Tax=Mucilaginibacter inviolabilis TaxID=2714892 RepID=UPI00140DDFC3|nr:hypothetical protein [Mucilaginibacter inviolabilis]NHA07642.1 hypothetical protein [Mucilaginibacter inviolabilis]
MKALFIITLFCSAVSIKATAQDSTISYKELPAYIGRKVTFLLPVTDFDVRREYIYLYMGNRYPDQEFTIIVKRNKGKKHIRLNKDIILGRVIAPFTGFISAYDEGPDTTKNYNDAAIKKEFEKGQPMEIYALHLHGMMSRKYEPRTTPIDLRGKLVMLVTLQKQIGTTTYEISHGPPTDFPSMLFDNPN